MCGAIFSFFGAMQQAEAMQAQANYQAQVAENNKIIAERNAIEKEKEGKRAANKYRSNVERAIAEETLMLVAQGGDVSFGTNIDLLAEYQRLGEEDARTIEANAGKDAYQSRVRGMNFGAQAGLHRGKADSIDPFMSGLMAGGQQAASDAAFFL